MKLEPCIKIADGRCETPENTIRRLEPILQSRYDYRMYEEKLSEHLYWSALFIDELGFRAMGKGISPALSRAGALAESAEWLAARGEEQLPGYTRAHQDTLEDPVRIEELLAHVSSADRQVVRRIKDSECAQHWVDAVSLLTGRTRKLPIRFVRRISGPNGLAAGNRIEEAVVHATNEVFERRAHVTVLRNRLVVPTVDPETVDAPVVHEQIDFVRSKGIDVTLKDLTFGGDLPCIGAYFADPNIPRTFQFHHFFKVGASFDREYALTRTFTEFSQGRRSDEFIGSRKEEQERVLRHDFRSLRCTGPEGDNFLSSFMFGFVPHEDAGFLAQGDVVPFDRGTRYADCLEDIEAAKRICRTLGKDYLVVDFTDPAIGFPVVEVVIPGYSDVLPFHPRTSDVLFRRWTRDDVLSSYDRHPITDHQ